MQYRAFFYIYLVWRFRTDSRSIEFPHTYESKSTTNEQPSLAFVLVFVSGVIRKPHRQQNTQNIQYPKSQKKNMQEKRKQNLFSVTIQLYVIIMLHTDRNDPIWWLM